MNPLLRALALIASALLFVCAADALIFWSPLYRAVLAPDSSAGSLEASVASARALPTNPRRDIFVVGDSRIYAGLDPVVASRAAGDLRLLDGGIPGTTPRTWAIYLRAIDPHADRFRALVIPVDTYADDDGAIGALDGTDRDQDLHYLAFRLNPLEALRVSTSFDDLPQVASALASTLLRAPLLVGDVRDFATDPAARFAALAVARRDASAYDPRAAHPRAESLRGLRNDARTHGFAFPASVSPDERGAIREYLTHVPRPSASYAAYRKRWLGAIVTRYRRAGVPVIFVRIPTRPLRVHPPESPSGTIVDFAADDGAWLLDPAPYLALERPELFADHDHLNAEGSRRFSALLGADVARALARGGTGFTPEPSRASRRIAASPTPTATVAPATAAPVFGNIDLQLRFQSAAFWLFFLIVTALFYAVPRRAKWGVLLVASYLFYASWNRWYVVFLLALTISDYLFGLALERATTGRRALLAFGVGANLAFLGTFKYANFATGTLASLLGLHADPWLVQLIVPIGISFHTFQSISYLVDVYRRRMEAVRSLFDYALYLAFFPQLLAGPIVRAEIFFRDFVAWRAPNADDVGYGIMRIVFGLVKKMAVADQFAPISDRYFANPGLYPGALDAWAAVLAFTLQIYFDFSGYSDIAIGCARLLGFHFPKNFDRPYLATSITEFWHRWHITLSQWLRDYLYIPLGGNRDGTLATLRNLILTMLLGGLWHGANWTFVAWGGYHGALLALERITGYGRLETRSLALNALRTLATFVLVMLGWVLFRAQSFPEALHVVRALVGGSGAPLFADWPTLVTAAVALCGAILFAARQRRVAIAWVRLPFAAQASMLGVLLFVFQFFASQTHATPFVYFKF